MKIKEFKDRHFTEFLTNIEDHELGDELSRIIGDTFITEKLTPLDQWIRIVKALRIHGLKIVEDKPVL